MARRSAWSPRSPPRRRRADDDDDEMSTEVLQITMAWERKRKQAEADLRDQLNEAEDTITEMGDKVATLERELAAATFHHHRRPPDASVVDSLGSRPNDETWLLAVRSGSPTVPAGARPAAAKKELESNC